MYGVKDGIYFVQICDLLKANLFLTLPFLPKETTYFTIKTLLIFVMITVIFNAESAKGKPISKL